MANNVVYMGSMILSVLWLRIAPQVVKNYTLHYIARPPNTMTATNVPMSIRLDVTARDKLKAIAARQKRTPHALATEAIHLLIAQKEREHAWADSCEAALRHFDETGLHATHDEVKAWMDSWGTDAEVPAPICHP